MNDNNKDDHLSRRRMYPGAFFTASSYEIPPLVHFELPCWLRAQTD